ncbi:hypothetical protein BDY17DRAFT_249118 [Neohortaea acidophila]|uniref:Endosomal peripheral membrane protein n=1 Tax=Neohortaea acidophila TaxID=245834 RepID=A0A6A6PX65_9PEZI|nr:uncharacterized protein BDY17DRAFT_249118 [Neohortaea acidophila]KAF2484346.1 hypothetical protein BDY17DRAFT_249118 [Neohortaea acidophila]
MTSTLLTNELTHLVSEAKRKNGELRHAAEKALQDLKSLPSTSEQQLAADLSRRPAFIDPFLLACATHNPKLAGSGVTCLQRLVVTRGLSKARLKDALEAFNSCTSLGLDVQLKILQALPSLLQNYAEDLKGDLLSGALEVCSSLQAARVPTVSGVAAATLQQLVSSIFEKVVNEDRHATEVAALAEVKVDDESLMLRPAAHDAFRSTFVQFTSLSQEAILELLWICINGNPQLFASHTELSSTVRSHVLPLATRGLSERLSFPLTLRSFRILDLVLGRYITRYPDDCLPAISLLIDTLDPDAVPLWKRAMAMEVFRKFFADGNLVIDTYSIYDKTAGSKRIVQDIMSAFVRMSSEKPSAIGLGQQSSIPVGSTASRDSADHIPPEITAGMAGLMGSTYTVAEANVPGISSRWSIPRTSCLEQLDKLEAPSVPETYVYALVLDCMGSLSDNLAKVVLPLTVHNEKFKSSAINGKASSNGEAARRHRTESYQSRTVPRNPLEQGSNEVPARVQSVHALVDSCWPAVLATSSTFLNAALDDQYYRNLIKAYQRFAQVAGLLRLVTARDALMTTLGKAAVPPHVVNATQPEPLKSPTLESPSVFSNPKSLLSMDSFSSTASPIERDRRRSLESARPTLTTRNLLCLRALLNLAIALGPTLDGAFAVVVDALRQADLVLSTTTPQQLIRQGSVASKQGPDTQSYAQAFSSEVTAVEGAASRLLESTADYPNGPFLSVLQTFCRLLHVRQSDASPASPNRQVQVSSPPPTPTMPLRSFSGLTGLSIMKDIQMRDYKFVIPKLGGLAELNISRFALGDPVETGWNLLVDEFVILASSNSNPVEARRAATGALCKLAAEVVAEVMEDEVQTRTVIQRRTLATLLRLVDSMYEDDGELTSNDIDVQSYVLEALQAILQRCGESLVAGWNRMIGIISSVFERNGAPPMRPDDEETHIDWINVSDEFDSVQLGRTAFAATQLICSDFLSALPTRVMPSLIELLFRFAKQTDDLNISLSTITIAWHVSDYLLSNVSRDAISETTRLLKEADEFEEEVHSASRDSPAAQWYLLLVRLRNIIKTGHKEVRKAAFQTVCSIFHNNGDQLPPDAWDLTLRSVVFKISFDDVMLYHSDDENDETQNRIGFHDESISSAIIGGTSVIVAQNLHHIEQVAQLPSLWEAFLSRLESYFDLQIHSINAAVFRALSSILSQITTGSKVWTGVMYRTLALWLKRNPATIEVKDSESNQDSLSAYVDSGTELYRLTQESMSTSQTRTLVENLYHAIRASASTSQYAVDTNKLTTVQGKAFDLLKAVRSDHPSTLIVVAAKLTTLHHDAAEEAPHSNGASFVAVASAAMEWLEGLVLSSVADEELYDSGVVVSVLENVNRMVGLKYLFTLEYKGVSIWRKASNLALALAGPVLQQVGAQGLDQAVMIPILTEFIGIATGMVAANGLERIGDSTRIYEDETTDIESFNSLRAVLTPHLGGAEVPDRLRSTYCQALFDASIIHEPEPGEIPDTKTPPLQHVQRIRRGRVRRVPYVQRERMAYECLSELLKLSGQQSESKLLAKAAAPFLILRLAIPLRAYIADQPLRGRRPQPLSELEELLFCFTAIKELRCGEEVLGGADASGMVMSRDRAHLRYLYPLLVKAVSTAGDRWSGADEVLTPLQNVLASVVPMQ